MRRNSRFRSRLIDFLLGGLVVGALLLLAAVLPRDAATDLSGYGRAIDGDSIRLEHEELRLKGIDAPELHQTCLRDKGGRQEAWHCGMAARDALRKLLRAEIACNVVAEDKYDRLLVFCRSGDIDINRQMVLDGWAVDYGDYAVEEWRASQAKRGIWASDFDRPAEWRQLHQFE